MKLDEWLTQNAVSRADFARRTGLSKGTVSQICNLAEAWLSRETAEVILRETNGLVTPNDFLSCGSRINEPCRIPSPKPSRPLHAVKS